MSEPSSSSPAGGQTAAKNSAGTEEECSSRSSAGSPSSAASPSFALVAVVRHEHEIEADRRYALAGEQRSVARAAADPGEGTSPEVRFPPPRPPLSPRPPRPPRPRSPPSGATPSDSGISALRTRSLELIARAPPEPDARLPLRTDAAGRVDSPRRRESTPFRANGRGSSISGRSSRRFGRTAEALRESSERVAGALSGRGGGMLGEAEALTLAARRFAEAAGRAQPRGTGPPRPRAGAAGRPSAGAGSACGGDCPDSPPSRPRRRDSLPPCTSGSRTSTHGSRPPRRNWTLPGDWPERSNRRRPKSGTSPREARACSSCCPVSRHAPGGNRKSSGLRSTRGSCDPRRLLSPDCSRSSGGASGSSDPRRPVSIRPGEKRRNRTGAPAASFSTSSGPSIPSTVAPRNGRRWTARTSKGACAKRRLPFPGSSRAVRSWRPPFSRPGNLLGKRLSAARDSVLAHLGPIPNPGSNPDPGELDTTPLLEVESTFRECTLFAMAALAREIRAAASGDATRGEEALEEAATRAPTLAANGAETLHGVVARGFDVLERSLERVLAGEEEERVALIFLLDDLRVVRGRTPFSSSLDFDPDLAAPAGDRSASVGDGAARGGAGGGGCERRAGPPVRRGPHARLVPEGARGVDAKARGTVPRRPCSCAAACRCSRAPRRRRGRPPVPSGTCRGRVLHRALRTRHPRRTRDAPHHERGGARVRRDRRSARKRRNRPIDCSGSCSSASRWPRATTRTSRRCDRPSGSTGIRSRFRSGRRARRVRRKGTRESDISMELIQQLEGIRAALDRIDGPPENPLR